MSFTAQAISALNGDFAQEDSGFGIQDSGARGQNQEGSVQPSAIPPRRVSFESAKARNPTVFTAGWLTRISQHWSGRAGLQPRRDKAFLI
ncbi:MAG: hypothetical protein WB763_10330, partial [Terriglobia bacterium]